MTLTLTCTLYLTNPMRGMLHRFCRSTRSIGFPQSSPLLPMPGISDSLPTVYLYKYTHTYSHSHSHTHTHRHTLSPKHTLVLPLSHTRPPSHTPSCALQFPDDAITFDLPPHTHTHTDTHTHKHTLSNTNSPCLSDTPALPLTHPRALCNSWTTPSRSTCHHPPTKIVT
jgi:hypothetical protein